MGTRIKGLLKGLRYISNIFDEEKGKEMQIGLPTDVKHVAHIGGNGPSSAEAPSWMKQYNGGKVVQSAPLNASGQRRENPEVKWGSQDSERRKSRKDLPELPRRDPSRSRSRRHQKLDAEVTAGRGGRRTKELSNDAPDSPSTPTSRKLVDGPKKSRRRKSKESSLNRSSKSKDKESYVHDRSTGSEDSLSPTPFSDPESALSDSSIGSPTNKGLPASMLKPLEEEKGKIMVF